MNLELVSKYLQFLGRSNNSLNLSFKKINPSNCLLKSKFQ